MLLSTWSHQVSMTNFLFIGFYLSLGEATVWKEAIRTRTKLSNLLHCKIIKYCLIGAESLSVSNIYLILVCWVKWEGHAFKLRERAWLLRVARAHLAAICKHVVQK